MSKLVETRIVRQNNQAFLLGTFKMSLLREFIRYTHRIVIDYDEANKPKYNDDVQRKISGTKVDGIADFLIYDTDAFFPTNIVVSLPSIAIEETVEIDYNHTNLYLKDIVITENKKPDGDTYITIIDGQHRIAGIEKAIKRVSDKIKNLEISIRTSDDTAKYEIELKEENALLKRLLDFEIIVSFFIDPTLEYQAMIFSTINRTQTKVSEDLVYSLFGLSKSDTPQKTALEVVLALNASEKSSLFNRMKLAGAKYQKDTIPALSQSAMVKSILYLITPNLKQAEIEKNKSRDYVKDKHFDSFLPFRKYYGNNEDAKIIKILNTFFKAVNEVFVSRENLHYWAIDGPPNILQTTVGYRALMLILVDILKKCREEERFDLTFYKNKLQAASTIDFEDRGEPKKFPLTSKSVNILYNEIGAKIFGASFMPKEVAD
ncbi:DGQHR domain-containing protein [Mucilaginibacter sp. RS28]|uniref:DGQHR domain-containing protein n=1 Tax=Mucilaginibacter straminoryzae TaxID=2932774 RepID=A0A9X1X4C2_9SPHI|nr:DGQHR domain-containing protein [Mucilaginibacter straminoryzae]MCJ8210819.1 DGQHR domain-containing protein [Mucilaginibacter straminoryzae]